MTVILSSSMLIDVSPIYNTLPVSSEYIPNVVSPNFLLEMGRCKCRCNDGFAFSPKYKVLMSSTGSPDAFIEGYCGNCIAFIDDDIDAGSACRALDVVAELSLIVDNKAFCSFDIVDCESTIGLYIFVNSCCSPISPNFSDRKFC